MIQAFVLSSEHCHSAINAQEAHRLSLNKYHNINAKLLNVMHVNGCGNFECNFMVRML